MAAGGRVGFEAVAWFNGGLFDDGAALPLEAADIETVLAASDLDWSEIDPSILGTLFERGLDPGKRAQLGAHYTDRDKIMLLVEPVVIRPWLAEWDAAKAEIAGALDRVEAAKSPAARTKRLNAAERRYRAFLNRLRVFTVLDPACGSGNFLYLALQALKDLEHRVQLEAEALGFQRAFPDIGPANVKGLEINPYAAELARVSVWIGEIQWMRRNGFYESRDPILKPLDTIECRDAILAPDSAEPDWPKADVVIVADPKGVIVAGETRYKAAVLIGLTAAPVVTIPAREARAFRVIDNRTSELTSWDTDLLPDALSGLNDLDIFSFDDVLPLAATAGKTDPDDIPETPKNPVSRRGHLDTREAPPDVRGRHEARACRAPPERRQARPDGDGPALRCELRRHLALNDRYQQQRHRDWEIYERRHLRLAGRVRALPWKDRLHLDEQPRPSGCCQRARRLRIRPTLTHHLGQGAHRDRPRALPLEARDVLVRRQERRASPLDGRQESLDPLGDRQPPEI